MDKEELLDDKLHWYKDAIIYELHIKAFKDGDGDGIGDFKGLLEKLDYLKDLGVTAIWLLPFYPSPLRDDGYDIADYYSINPSFGDIEQFKAVLREAHQRDLKVITELVINHTSDQHPWFQRARRAPKNSTERNYYVWTDDPGQYKDVRIIFQDYETSNWTWDAVAKQYYWHRFFHHQPDLNYDNEAVQQEVFRIIDFWCSMGVDGFRLDAVPYLFERENTNGENLPETHTFLKRLRSHIDLHFPETVLLAEANMWPEDAASYFGTGDECHMNYHFPVMPRMFMALQMEDRYPITDIFDQTPAIPANCQWAIFLRNHDELTLEMVTDEERDYMYKVYAKNPKARINLGIRHRLAPLMENNRRKIELMNVLLFSLKGTPVIYYGDEIGMGDNFYLGDRDGVRTPMQWSPDRNAGFSNANPQQLYLPLILDPEYQFESVNVETQRRNPSSLLWFMKHLINMRKNFKAFGRGEMIFINSNNPKVLAFVRKYQSEIILVIVNLSRYTQSAELELAAYKSYYPVEVFSRNKFPAIKDPGDYFFTLGPHDHHWLQLEIAFEQSLAKSILPILRLSSYDDFYNKNMGQQFAAEILPGFLQNVKWFNIKKRKFRSITIVNNIQLPSAAHQSALLLFEIYYEGGLPEMYQLPLIFLPGELADSYRENFGTGVICRVQINDKEMLLCDAFYTSGFRKTVLKNLQDNQSLEVGNNQIFFNTVNQLPGSENNKEEEMSKLLSIDEMNVSVAYGNQFFLKMYRQVERSVHPEVEVVRFLSEVMPFEQVPAYLGSITLHSGNDIFILGMLQELAPYHGNGKTFMLQRLDNYYDRIAARESHPSPGLKGTLAEPLCYEDFADDLKEFIGGTVAEGMQLIGVRVGELHKALASSNDTRDFSPEPFSLHYQRSLFSGFQSLVRSTLNNGLTDYENLPTGVKEKVVELISHKDKVLNTLKRIYTNKIDVVKTRIHGNLALEKLIFTGRDIAIIDFLGDRNRTFSERRIKRSPLRDVAGLIRSIYYTAYEGLILKFAHSLEEQKKLEPFAALWIHYVAGLFMRAYLDTVTGEKFIPANKKELSIMLNSYLLEKGLHSFSDEINQRPAYVNVPLQIIEDCIGAD